MDEEIKVPALPDDAFTVVPFNDEESEKIAYSNYSYWRSVFRTFVKSKSSMFFLGLLLFVVIFSIIQQFLPNQSNPNFTEYIDDYSMWKHVPTLKHWFGTDDIGRDLWARTWYGARISMGLAGLVVATEFVIGVIIGTIWGFVRKLDPIMLAIYNTISNIPSTVLLILLTYILSPGFWTLYLALSMTGWLSMAKTMRNQVIIIRDREFNLASKCLGTPISRVITKNLIPHLVSVIIMRLALAIPGVIIGESTLTFLGLGLPPEIPSLGVLLNNGRNIFTYRPHVMFFPALVISIMTISFYISGNAFADAADPRNHM